MLMYYDIYANDCNVSKINVYITIQTICSILAISLHKLLNSKHLFRKLFLLSYKVYSYKMIACCTGKSNYENSGWRGKIYYYSVSLSLSRVTLFSDTMAPGVSQPLLTPP